MYSKICIAVIALVLSYVNGLPADGYGKPPKPYNYEYAINDPYKGLNLAHNENSDGNQVQGSYTVQLPDGRRQIVKYIADHDSGYQADVTYEGQAQYPPHSDKVPFVVKHPSGGGYQQQPQPYQQKNSYN